MVILALLAEAPMHAYRMQQLIEERGKDTVVNVAQRNSVYQTIARLLRDDLIRVQATSRDERRPERVVYQITERGLATLHETMRSMLSTPRREFPEFPAALAFLMLLTPSEVIRLLETRVAALERRLAEETEVTEAALASGVPRLFLIEDDYRHTMIRTELAWVRALIDDIREKRLTWSKKWIREIAEAMERK